MRRDGVCCRGVRTGIDPPTGVHDETTFGLWFVGMNTNHPPVLTCTCESDRRASRASGIGPNGVSAHTTKPVNTITNEMHSTRSIYLRLLLLRALVVHHQSQQNKYCSEESGPIRLISCSPSKNCTKAALLPLSVIRKFQ